MFYFDAFNIVSYEKFVVQNMESLLGVAIFKSPLPFKMKLISCNAHWRIGKFSNWWVP
jgi:hypothetical protein